MSGSSVTNFTSGINPAATTGTALAGGDLGGSLPGPTVIGIQGTPVSPTAPTAGQELVYNASTGQWEPTSEAAGFIDPMTTEGDLIYRHSGVPARLPVGGASAVLHGGTDPAYSAVVEGDLSLTNVTTADVSITKHGFAPKAPNDATKFLDGTGAYSKPTLPFHDESLTDGAENFIFAGGDIVTAIGVPNP
jgi:hypothetical protein